MNFRVDQPKQESGTSNDGKTAGAFFNAEKKQQK